MPAAPQAPAGPPSSIEPFDPFRPDFRADPYPVYRRYREQAPVNWGIAAIPGFPGCWYFFRYRDVEAGLKDPRFGRELRRLVPPEALPPVPEAHRPFVQAVGNFMLFRDPPTHTRLRSLVSRAFTPRMVERRRPRIAAIADELLDAVEPRGAMDLIADYAFPLPVMVIAELLGVRPEDHDRFRAWSMAVAAAIDVRATADVYAVASEATVGLMDYLRDVVAERRQRPEDDLISGLVAIQQEGGDDRLTDDELLATCGLLLVAGHETTVNLIGNGLLALLRHPEQWERLSREPAGVTNAVEELLRYDSPVQMTFRFAFEDVALDGQAIKRGDQVCFVLGAANRDPEQFPDPERLDIGRRVSWPSSFGFGIHYCLGAPLARLEGQLALEAVLRRMPGLRLATDTTDWRDNIALRGLQRLPVTF